MNIAVMGCGTVGGGVVEIIDNRMDKGSNLKVTRILDKIFREGDNRFTDKIEDITEDDTIDLVVESMGGIEPAHTFILAALNAGKHVVTSNKAVVSKYMKEFVDAANDNSVGLFLEATAGGGVPWIHNLMRVKRIDQITQFSGIINGTSNFIIDKMEKENADFSETLKLAQEKGYAEANPSADIDGDDVKAKSMISASIAFSTLCTDEIPKSGIRNLTAEDIEVFKELGLRVRMITRGQIKGDKYFVTVEPQLCEENTLEANTPGYFNTVSLTGETIGELKFFGAGAGALPTANAIVQDIIDCADGKRPVYDLSRELEFDETIMPSTYLFRTKAEHSLPRQTIMIRPGYFEIGGKYPAEAHQIAENLLVVDPNSFMASIQKTV